jgi:CheY-like chemotaxis protein
MLIGTIESNAETQFLTFIQDVNSQTSGSWGILAVEKSNLKPLSTDAFILALKPALEDAVKATVFFLPTTIYIAWSGMQGRIEKQLQEIIAGLSFDPYPDSIYMRYIDPVSKGNELHQHVCAEIAEAQRIQERATQEALNNFPSKMGLLEKIDFTSTGLNLPEYKTLLEKKRHHEKLHTLIIEDQPFLRQLLYETLHVDHEVFTASTVKEGLEIYLKEVPHIVFLDIGLPDASGHELARKLHEIDPTSYVVMVTGSRQREDVEEAKENGVHGFIVKPFSKGKIEEAIHRYTTAYPNFCETRH